MQTRRSLGSSARPRALLRRAVLLLGLGGLCLIDGPGRHWRPPSWPAGAVRRVHFSHATHVLLGHPGVHTHENFLEFAIAPDVQAAVDDRWHRNHRNLQAVGHSILETNRAAAPRGLPALSGLIPSYGPIEGRPSDEIAWDVLSAAWTLRQGGWGIVQDRPVPRGYVRLFVPSRFVNWLDRQPPAVRRRYEDPRNYSLDLSWEERPAPAAGP